jgi:hypothetical protein
LGLKWFIYQGSNIKTTRPFCRKKAGKVFSVEEAAKWRNDPDLVGKSSAATYNPLLERGRYNCRHHIGYISERLAKRLAPEKFGADNLDLKEINLFNNYSKYKIQNAKK